MSKAVGEDESMSKVEHEGEVSQEGEKEGDMFQMMSMEFSCDVTSSEGCKCNMLLTRFRFIHDDEGVNEKIYDEEEEEEEERR